MGVRAVYAWQLNVPEAIRRYRGMESIDNGMVINGSREWERMYMDTPYDLATDDEIEDYAYDRERIHEIVEMVCYLDSGDLAEDVAIMVYDQLRPERKKKRLRDWFKTVNPDDFNEWKGGK